MREELQVLGLTRNESEVYEALVKSGLTKAGHLIARLDVHRNIVYEALESLIRKGFVTKISKRREQIAEGVIKEIKQARQQIEQQITVYEGIDSYRAYWISSLLRFPEGTVDYCLGVPRNAKWESLMGASALKQYREVRRRKKIIWKTILFKVEDVHRERLKKFPDSTEYRYWPKDFNPSGNFNVIHDTVILQAMTDNPRIIEIRDKDMVTVFKNYFDAIWSEAKPVLAEK